MEKALIKKLKKLRLRSIQILFNTEYHLKVNGKALIFWKPFKAKTGSSTAYYVHKICWEEITFSNSCFIRGRRGLLLSIHACRYSTSISIRCKRLIILKPPWNNKFFNQRGKYSKIRYQINTHIYSFRKYTFSTKTPLILLIPFFFQKIVIFWQKIAPLIKAIAWKLY